MGYTDYDYSFVFKDYKGENGPNWQKTCKEQVRYVKGLLNSKIIILSNIDDIFVWSTSKKPVYPELLPLIQLVYTEQGESNIFLNKEFVKRLYIESFNNVNRHKADFTTSFFNDLYSDNVFWRRQSTIKLMEIVKSYFTGQLYVENGVAKWSSNNNVIPRDCYEVLVYTNIPSKVYISKYEEARKNETSQIIDAYRKKQKGYKPSAEERVEMENAFGRGTPVVDILTERRIL